MMRRTMTMLALAALPMTTAAMSAQDMIHVRDLTIEDKAIPVRLMGYGLVIGLDGTGDRSSGGNPAA
jgi:flagellar P-ring protein precursor FlgI